MTIDFSWSKSRDDLFKECLRKYYYQYYGSRGDLLDENVKEIFVLKNLCSRYVWMGKTVHEMIQYLLANIKGGRNIHLGELLSKLKTRLESSFEFSLIGGYRDIPCRGGLIEHEYNLLVLEEYWEELFKSAEKCIINFYNSDALKYIKSKKIEDWIFLEDILDFNFDGTKIFLSIDFAVREGDKIILFDWKTGKERDVKMDVQLTCYALYIMQKFGVDAKNITVRKYNPALDKEDTFDINDEMIGQFKDYIKERIVLMKDFSDGDTIDIEKFSKTGDYRKCVNCKFKKVCKPDEL